MKYTRTQTTYYKIDEKKLQNFLIAIFGEEEAKKLLNDEEDLREWLDELDEDYFVEDGYAGAFAKIINYDFESDLVK